METCVALSAVEHRRLGRVRRGYRMVRSRFTPRDSQSRRVASLRLARNYLLRASPVFATRARFSRCREFVTVVVSLPTLPLPPLFYTSPDLGSAEKMELISSLAKFALTLSRERGIRVLDSQALELATPLNSRHDIKSEILTGFPYKLPYTSTFARKLASLVSNRTPKKGLITDLDDTVWSGILGEVGVDGISWTLEHHSQVHGLYQQFLSSLASAGVLIGVASKNDLALVQEAFARKDLLLKKENVFPFEVHWNAKSESVQRILKLWNIGPEAVSFHRRSAPWKSPKYKQLSLKWNAWFLKRTITRRSGNFWLLFVTASEKPSFPPKTLSAWRVCATLLRCSMPSDKAAALLMIS